MRDLLDKTTRIGITEASLLLNQTTKQLQRWDNDGTFPAHKTDGGNRYYYHHDIAKMTSLLAGTTRKDVAERLSVSEKTVWRWNKDGMLPVSYRIGNVDYYDDVIVKRFIEVYGNQGVQHEVASV